MDFTIGQRVQDTRGDFGKILGPAAGRAGWFQVEMESWVWDPEFCVMRSRSSCPDPGREPAVEIKFHTEIHDAPDAA